MIKAWLKFYIGSIIIKVDAYYISKSWYSILVYIIYFHLSISIYTSYKVKNNFMLNK